MKTLSMGKIKDYFQPLHNSVISPPVSQFEGKVVPLISLSVKSQFNKLDANLPSSVSKKDHLSVSEDRVLLDSASCVKKKNTEGSKERVENSPSLDAYNYSEQSAELSVGSHEKSTQLLVSNDKSQGLFDATQLIP